MAMPKRYARRIEVDGVRYLWRVRPRTPSIARHEKLYGTIDSSQDPSLSFAVQSEESPGQVLVVHLPREYPCWSGEVAVVPSIVAHSIRAGLARGWRPSDRGPQFIHRPMTATETNPDFRFAGDLS
jgi:hypothetical protein